MINGIFTKIGIAIGCLWGGFDFGRGILGQKRTIDVHIEQTINDASDPDKILAATRKALDDSLS